MACNSAPIEAFERPARATGTDDLLASVVLGLAGRRFRRNVTIVRSRCFPAWTLPLAGGILVKLVAVLWYTSALWYYNDFSVPLLK
jgi:uncharacterized protein DUF6529